MRGGTVAPLLLTVPEAANAIRLSDNELRVWLAGGTNRLGVAVGQPPCLAHLPGWVAQWSHRVAVLDRPDDPCKTIFARTAARDHGPACHGESGNRNAYPWGRVAETSTAWGANLEESAVAV